MQRQLNQDLQDLSLGIDELFQRQQKEEEDLQLRAALDAQLERSREQVLRWMGDAGIDSNIGRLRSIGVRRVEDLASADKVAYEIRR